MGEEVIHLTVECHGVFFLVLFLCRCRGILRGNGHECHGKYVGNQLQNGVSLCGSYSSTGIIMANTM